MKTVKQSKKQSRNSDESSSLDYLNDLQEGDDSKFDAELSKRERSWVDNRSSENVMKKMPGGYRRKQKYVDDQTVNEGIFLYKPGVQLPNLCEFCNQIIKVIIASEFIKKERILKYKDNIFGTDTYTSNSDLLGISIHAGFINLANFNHQKYEGVEIIFKVIKPRRNYIGSYRNGLYSYSLKTYNGYTLKPQNEKLLVSLPPIKLLEQYANNMHIPVGKSRQRKKPVNINALIPIPEIHLTFNMNNEPAHKYSLINIADKGYNRSDFLTAKLQNMVLYIETADRQKFQICKTIENQYFQVYQLCKLKKPYECDNIFFKKHGAPVPQEHRELIITGLQWDQIIWANEGVTMRDMKINMVENFKFYEKRKDI